MRILVPFITLLIWSIPAWGQKVQFHVAGFAGIHVFEKETDLHEEAFISEETYNNYPANSALLGGTIGLSHRNFTVETSIGIVPTKLRKSDQFSPVYSATIAGIFRLENTLPVIVPYVKIEGGVMGIISKDRETGTDLDYVGGVGFGGLYRINRKMFVRLECTWLTIDAVEAATANNLQVRALFGWMFDR